MAKNYKLIALGIAIILVGLCCANIIGALSASYYIDKDFRSSIYGMTRLLEFGMMAFPVVGFICVVVGCAVKFKDDE